MALFSPLLFSSFSPDKVVCWRLDRLGRTAKGLLTLLDELQQPGVGFVSLREGFDLERFTFGQLTV
jgi:DNA invertase Pin-like site-specific DNA recombinase